VLLLSSSIHITILNICTQYVTATQYQNLHTDRDFPISNCRHTRFSHLLHTFIHSASAHNIHVYILPSSGLILKLLLMLHEICCGYLLPFMLSIHRDIFCCFILFFQGKNHKIKNFPNALYKTQN
jgi:hypothetical protein